MLLLLLLLSLLWLLLLLLIFLGGAGGVKQALTKIFPEKRGPYPNPNVVGDACYTMEVHYFFREASHLLPSLLETLFGGETNLLEVITERGFEALNRVKTSPKN